MFLLLKILLRINKRIFSIDVFRSRLIRFKQKSSKTTYWQLSTVIDGPTPSERHALSSTSPSVYQRLTDVRSIYDDFSAPPLQRRRIIYLFLGNVRMRDGHIPNAFRLNTGIFLRVFCPLHRNPGHGGVVFVWNASELGNDKRNLPLLFNIFINTLKYIIYYLLESTMIDSRVLLMLLQSMIYELTSN